MVSWTLAGSAGNLPRPADVENRAPNTPRIGWRMRGKVDPTYLANPCISCAQVRMTGRGRRVSSVSSSPGIDVWLPAWYGSRLFIVSHPRETRRLEKLGKVRDSTGLGYHLDSPTDRPQRNRCDTNPF